MYGAENRTALDAHRRRRRLIRWWLAFEIVLGIVLGVIAFITWLNAR
ncbi:MAG: hypothetical protein ACREEN_01535 [Stellaceae bacterium]